MREIRLLIADDHAVVRSGTRELLEQQPDLKILGEASNGEQAVKMAQDLEPDVIVMDVRMPKMSGVEATRKIKSEHPDVKVLVLTAHDDDEYVFALLQAGVGRGRVLGYVRHQDPVILSETEGVGQVPRDFRIAPFQKQEYIRFRKKSSCNTRKGRLCPLQFALCS